VGGLPHNLNIEDFRSYFEQFGDLDDCVILKDKRTQKPRGFGFVTYSKLESIEAVMKEKDQHVI
jgi:RNA recognition motif-containing protein